MGMARPAAGVAASNFLSSALYLQTVPSRRTLVCGAAGGCTVAPAGCAEILRGSPNPDVGRPELRGSLVGDADTATVVVDVENRGPTGEIRVIAEVVNHDDTVLDSYERTTEIDGGETRTFEMEITPREDAATVTVRASSG